MIVAYCTLLHPCCAQPKDLKYATSQNTKNPKNKFTWSFASSPKSILFKSRWFPVLARLRATSSLTGISSRMDDFTNLLSIASSNVFIHWTWNVTEVHLNLNIRKSKTGDSNSKIYIFLLSIHYIFECIIIFLIFWIGSLIYSGIVK